MLNKIIKSFMYSERYFSVSQPLLTFISKLNSPKKNPNFVDLKLENSLTLLEKKILQENRLRNLFIDAYENSEFYRGRFSKIGIDLESLYKCDVYHVYDKLPFLTKNDISENIEKIKSKKFNSKPNVITTGGSTGTPQKFYFSDDMIACRNAHWQLWMENAGVNQKEDRMLYIGMHGRVLEDKDYYGSIQKDGCFILPALYMTDEKLHKAVESIKKFKPTFIRGYASGCYMFANFISEFYPGDIQLKAVLTSSDQLLPHYRKKISETFGCKVFDFYGQNEDVATASQCVAGSGYHVNMTNNFITLHDQNGVRIEEENVSGIICGTHLKSNLFPLIKYVVNDLASVETKTCACGFQGDVITAIEGRKDDFIVSKSGVKFAAGALNQPMKSRIGEITELQIIQKEYDYILVNYVKGSKFNETTLTVLRSNLTEFLGNEFSMDFVDCGALIPRLKNGKFRMIINETLV